MPTQSMAERNTMSRRATGSVFFSSCLRVVVSQDGRCDTASAASAASVGRTTNGRRTTGSGTSLQETKHSPHCVPERGTPAKKVPAHASTDRRRTQRNLKHSGPPHQPAHKLAEDGLAVLERPARRVNVLAQLCEGETRGESRDTSNAERQDCRVGVGGMSALDGGPRGAAKGGTTTGRTAARPRTDPGPRDVLCSESDNNIDPSTDDASLGMRDSPEGRRV